MDGIWHMHLRFTKLTGTEKESQVLVVVQAPHTVRASRLEIVGQLEFAHENHVALEHFIDCAAKISLIVDTKLKQTEEERNEVQLVASTVVDSLIAAKRFFPVHFDLGNGSFETWESSEFGEFLVRSCNDAIHQRAIRSVTKSHWLLNRRNLVDPRRDQLKQVVKWSQILHRDKFGHARVHVDEIYLPL